MAGFLPPGSSGGGIVLHYPPFLRNQRTTGMNHARLYPDLYPNLYRP